MTSTTTTTKFVAKLLRMISRKLRRPKLSRVRCIRSRFTFRASADDDDDDDCDDNDDDDDDDDNAAE